MQQTVEAGGTGTAVEEHETTKVDSSGIKQETPTGIGCPGRLSSLPS